MHVALLAILDFVSKNGRYPAAGDVNACMETAKDIVKREGHISVDIEAEVFEKAVSWAGCSVSPLAAFFGGIVAQEIVKYTGKYSPLRQWLHFDIYEALPREAVNREPMGSRYDDQI